MIAMVDWQGRMRHGRDRVDKCYMVLVVEKQGGMGAGSWWWIYRVIMWQGVE